MTQLRRFRRRQAKVRMLSRVAAGFGVQGLRVGEDRTLSPETRPRSPVFQRAASMRERTVRLPTDVQETIRSLHPELKRRVRLALDLLRTKPGSGKELQGELSGWRSLRAGRFRIVYREVRSVIEVAAIGPRASIYLETALRVARRQPRRRKNSR